MYKSIKKSYNEGGQESREKAYSSFFKILNVEESNLYKKYLKRYNSYLPKINAEKQLMADFIITMSRYIEEDHETLDKHSFYSMAQHQIRITYNIEMGFANERTKVKNGEEYVKVPKYATFNKLMENKTATEPVQEYIVLLEELSEYLISRFGKNKFWLFEARYIHHEQYPEISFYAKRDGIYNVGPFRIKQICDEMRERAANWLNKKIW